MDQEVVIPVTNFGNESLCIGDDLLLATIEKFKSVTEFSENSQENASNDAWKILDCDLPAHLQALFE
jgi:hypothetical protein